MTEEFVTNNNIRREIIAHEAALFKAHKGDLRIGPICEGAHGGMHIGWYNLMIIVPA